MGEITPPYYQKEDGTWVITIYGNATSVNPGNGAPYAGDSSYEVSEIVVRGQPIDFSGLGNAGYGIGYGLGSPPKALDRGLFYLILAAVLGVTLVATKGKVRFA